MNTLEATIGSAGLFTLLFIALGGDDSASRRVSIIQAVISGVLAVGAFLPVVDVLWRPITIDEFLSPHPYPSWIAFTLGYLLYDLCFARSIDRWINVHHVSVGLALTICLSRESMVGGRLLAGFLTNELSTPFLHMAWLREQEGKDPLFMHIIFAILFVALRVVFVNVLFTRLVSFVVSNWSTVTRFYSPHSVVIIIGCLMVYIFVNQIWFSHLVRAARTFDRTKRA